MGIKTKNKGKWGDKFMNLFFEESKDGDGENATPTETRRPSAVPTKSVNFDDVPDKYRNRAIVDKPTTSPALQAKFSEEFYNHFQSVIEENDLDGSDYFEFQKSFNALKSGGNMSDVAALQATYSVLKATSPELTIPRLLETADFYLSVIDKEDADFQEQLVEKTQTEIHNRDLMIEKEQIRQSDIEQKIIDLKAEMSQSEDTVEILVSEIQTERTKIEEVKQNWDYTINVVKNNIETDKTNIQTHIGKS